MPSRPARSNAANGRTGVPVGALRPFSFVAAYSPDEYVSRGGVKLAAALDAFGIDPRGWVCADLGANVGGFTDCLLRRAAAKVYAVERGYGVLDFRLRRDPRVVVMERADARHLALPERVHLVVIDIGWTRQAAILPAARRLVADDGCIVSLIKPHYEASPGEVVGGVLPDERIEGVLAAVRSVPAETGLAIVGEIESPIRGAAGNREFLWQLRLRSSPD